VFLFGDSHAQMFVPALRNAVSRDYSLVYATKPAVPPQQNNCFLGTSDYCRRVGDRIATLLKPGDIIAISFASWKMTPVLVPPAGFKGSFDSMEKYVSLIRWWSNEANKSGASVLVLGDQTVMKDQGLFCIPSSFNPDAGAKCARTRKWGTYFAAKFRAKLRELLDTVVSNAYFFDARDLFCGDLYCGAMIPGTRTLAIGDQEHLTIEGSTYLWPFLCSFLSKQGLLPYRPPDEDSMNISG